MTEVSYEERASVITKRPLKEEAVFWNPESPPNVPRNGNKDDGAMRPEGIEEQESSRVRR